MSRLIEIQLERNRARKSAALLTGLPETGWRPNDLLKRSGDDIASKLEIALKTASIHELEDSPRNTVLRMLMERQLEELFTFKVSLGTGVQYVQAMRMVLSRARKRARDEKKRLDEFKLFEVAIKSEADHDVVTLMRSKRMTKEQESVYDKITELFEKQPLNNK